MKKIIISGSTGLIGKAFSKYLSSNNIEVYCLGEKFLSSAEIFSTFKFKANYFSIPMKNIKFLKEVIKKRNLFSEEFCAFYNFAWRGKDKLTDGNFESQILNATYAANAVRVAKDLNCKKFINIGSIEETFAENWLSKKTKVPFSSSQSNYAISKLASRDICKIISYLEKIDYIHTRLSVPLDFSLNQGNYISNTLKKITLNLKYQNPNNKQLFDIISLNDVCKALYLIGLHGKNKRDYYIGNAKPNTLENYFSHFYNILNNKPLKLKKFKNSESNLFNIAELKSDTLFEPELSFDDLAKSFIKK